MTTLYSVQMNIYDMRVLVTGGTGLVGSAIMELKPEWTYIGSADCNLLNRDAFIEYLKSNENFDFVIHLAANVGGLFKNKAQKIKMYQDNLRINLNVIEACYEAGIPRMICCLSTCVFPDGLERTMTESDLHMGEPHGSNFGYAYAKRMIDVHCKLINNNSNFFYQSIIPTNIYGPYDQFSNPINAHVIPALITKAASLAANNETKMQICGSGRPIRQFIYSRDLARIICIMVECDIKVERIICAPDFGDEYSIANVAKLIADNFGITNIVPEDDSPGDSDGQFTKTCSNRKLRSIFPDFEFTSLSQGIRETCDWYKQYYLAVNS